jgi:peptidyl-prolyl cis-trans isomerase SurA
MQRQLFLKKIAVLSLFGCILGVPSLYSQQAQPQQAQQPSQQAQQPSQQDKEIVLNAIVAIVNDDVITFSQMRDLVGSQEEALEKQYGSQPDLLKAKLVQLREEAVNELIDRQLILQEFKKMQAKGASIPDYVLEDHIQTIIRGSFNGDRKAFIRTLDSQGFTLQKYKQMEMDKIIVSGMRQREAKIDLVIPPHEIEQYYAEHHDEFSIPDEIKLRMISLTKTGATDATQRALADEIQQKVSSGADFGNMAQLYSQTHADAQGDWGWITRKDLNEQLTKVAFSLKPGQISNVVDSEGSYWLLFVEAKKPGGSKAFKDVRDDIEKKLHQVEEQKQQEKWIAGLRQKAYIKTF